MRRGSSKKAPSTSSTNSSPMDLFRSGKAATKELERIDQLYYTYANESSGMIDPEGIEYLCSDLEVEHTDVRILMLAWKMQSEKQGYFTLPLLCCLYLLVGRIEAVDSDGHLRSCPSGWGGVRRLDGRGSTSEGGARLQTSGTTRDLAPRKENVWRGCQVMQRKRPSWWDISDAEKKRLGLERNEIGRYNFRVATAQKWWGPQTCSRLLVETFSSRHKLKLYGLERTSLLELRITPWLAFLEKCKGNLRLWLVETSRTHSKRKRESWCLDEGGRTIVREEDIRKRWGEYFSSLFNESPPIESRPERSGDVGSSRHQMHYDCYYSRINQGEVRAALQRMGRNKAVGPDQIPIEAWRCLEDEGVKWLTCLFNKIFLGAKMPDEWRLS
ncbi:retrovirus-related pol polyprotein LINE-1 [Tanacetum coccineum]